MPLDIGAAVQGLAGQRNEQAARRDATTAGLIRQGASAVSQGVDNYAQWKKEQDAKEAVKAHAAAVGVPPDQVAAVGEDPQELGKLIQEHGERLKTTDAQAYQQSQLQLRQAHDTIMQSSAQDAAKDQQSRSLEHADESQDRTFTQAKEMDAQRAATVEQRERSLGADQSMLLAPTPDQTPTFIGSPIQGLERPAEQGDVLSRAAQSAQGGKPVMQEALEGALKRFPPDKSSAPVDPLQIEKTQAEIEATRALTKQRMGEGAGPKAAGPYDTALTPEEEKGFQSWKEQYAPQDSGADYDLRGAFKSGLKPDAKSGHWPDTYKKPNHPTFSNESIYAPKAPEFAGHWEGETYIPPKGRQGKSEREGSMSQEQSARATMVRERMGQIAAVFNDVRKQAAYSKRQLDEMLVEYADLKKEYGTIPRLDAKFGAGKAPAEAAPTEGPNEADLRKAETLGYRWNPASQTFEPVK